MLFVALLAIASLAMVEKISFQIKRDREEELIHRGVQYSRAVRRYFKKFGRYPTRVEELESTNNLRFLRKRYKDPITGKDFKLLHMTDVQVSINPGAASGLPPGPDASISADQPGAPTPSGTASTGPGANPLPGAAQPGEQREQQEAAAAATLNPPGQAGPQTASQPGAPGAAGGPGAAAGPTPGPQVFGGGAVVGVASTSKEKTIREFNKKDRYNQWQFIYDPSSDRGGLLTTPNQPQLAGAVPVNQQNGVPAAAGQHQGFGPSPGMNAGPQPQQPSPPQPDQQ